MQNETKEAKKAIEDLLKILYYLEFEKKEEFSEDIIDFTNKMKNKYGFD